MVKLTPSGRGNPCPICGRHEDGDCRTSETKILCWHGTTHGPPDGLRPGQVLDGGWAYTGETVCGGWAVFVAHESSPRSAGSSPRSVRDSPRSAAPAGEMEAFLWLEQAGQLEDQEGFRSSLAQAKAYSTRWREFSQGDQEAARAVELEMETARGLDKLTPDEVMAGLRDAAARAAAEEVEASTPPAAAVAGEAAISRSKPQKLEAGELLDLLRGRAQGGQIRYNTFSQEIEINGQVFEGAERFYLMLAEQGYKVGKELALDCLVQVAHENIYDPVVLYLEHVAATVERGCIDVLSTTYLRPEDRGHEGPTLYDAMLRCTLIGAVRRAFEPGCKHDTACVLMGDQGARKSSFWSALGGAFFSDSLGDISSKDDVMVLHRSWIMEWAELDHVMGRRHAGQIKSFLSQSTDLYRKPYAKAPGAFPRRGVIVGSTNRSSGFLQDETGNRRFWVIPTTKTEADPIDTPSLLADRDAIWSAAVHAYRNGDPSYLPTNLAQAVAQENECYQVENPWRVPIETWLQSPANNLQPITSELLLNQAVQRPVERQSRADQMQVGSIMRELGYQKRRQSVDGVLKWVFFQP